ncbi:hypothetical protein V7S43_005577 [Phytophthora oleae]|uniref:Membrane-associated protein n=1 Tax=Phytophthora oleae TaxID=2107226 RepID=A0ABD3FSB8_9STRA
MTSEEMNGVYVTVAVTSIVAGILSIVRTFALWSKLSGWNPIDPLIKLTFRLRREQSRLRSLSTKSSNSDIPNDEIMLEVTESSRSSCMNTPNNLKFCELVDENSASSQSLVYQRGVQASVFLLCIILTPLLVVGIASSCPALVVNAALNATLIELFGHALGDTSPNLIVVDTDSNTAWVDPYIHSATENYTLLQDDSLYRRTTDALQASQAI